MSSPLVTSCVVQLWFSTGAIKDSTLTVPVGPSEASDCRFPLSSRQLDVMISVYKVLDDLKIPREEIKLGRPVWV